MVVDWNLAVAANTAPAGGPYTFGVGFGMPPGAGTSVRPRSLDLSVGRRHAWTTVKDARDGGVCTLHGSRTRGPSGSASLG